MDEMRTAEALRIAIDTLLAERRDGHWEGRLSSSALSTSTAVSALSIADVNQDTDRIESAAQWLANDQNDDGGWGDSPESPSNLSTTMLAVAALHLSSMNERARFSGTMNSADGYLARIAGKTPQERAEALRRVYGKDRTFAVPILANCALAGLADWRDVAPLPFELAVAPPRLLRALRLHVVSYALPALIAIGRLIHARRPSQNPFARVARRFADAPSLQKLEAIQPESGGFLEAIPLTSFVVMSLIARDETIGPVARKGLEFLRETQRDDGAWPIDVDLSMWMTTSAVTALSRADALPDPQSARDWILRYQWRETHPYTNADGGGWAWTDRSGGVPDADDTAGALIALAALGDPTDAVNEAATAGLRWLLDLQNGDGGWPTFCRGWSKLPFDQSAPDLTAHVLRAIAVWPDDAPKADRQCAIARGLSYLERSQRDDGSWTPLWFGSQQTSDRSNPVFGASRVLRAYADLGVREIKCAGRGVDFLLSNQNDDGGWGAERGCASSIEETALAVEALCDWSEMPSACEAVDRGTTWLTARIREGGLETPTPIGLYFAMLWYSERLYPMIWGVSALASSVARQLGKRESSV